jgi:hypothetical protein
MAGKIIADQIEHSTAGSLDTSYVVNGSAKAWVLASNSAVLTDSFNTSSGLDNGGGDYTFTFTSAMSSANFESSATPSNWAKRYGSIAARTTTTVQLKFYDEADVLADVSSGIAVHGDLA